MCPSDGVDRCYGFYRVSNLCWKVWLGLEFSCRLRVPKSSAVRSPRPSLLPSVQDVLTMLTIARVSHYQFAPHWTALDLYRGAEVRASACDTIPWRVEQVSCSIFIYILRCSLIWELAHGTDVESRTAVIFVTAFDSVVFARMCQLVLSGGLCGSVLPEVAAVGTGTVEARA
jgi:hypothetical protein